MPIVVDYNDPGLLVEMGQRVGLARDMQQLQDNQFRASAQNQQQNQFDVRQADADRQFQAEIEWRQQQQRNRLDEIERQRQFNAERDAVERGYRIEDRDFAAKQAAANDDRYYNNASRLNTQRFMQDNVQGIGQQLGEWGSAVGNYLTGNTQAQREAARFNQGRDAKFEDRRALAAAYTQAARTRGEKPEVMAANVNAILAGANIPINPPAGRESQDARDTEEGLRFNYEAAKEALRIAVDAPPDTKGIDVNQAARDFEEAKRNLQQYMQQRSPGMAAYAPATQPTSRPAFPTNPEGQQLYPPPTVRPPAPNGGVIVPPPAPTPQTATHPQTGQKIMKDPRTGRWVPIQ